MRIANRVAQALLASPLHRIASGSMLVVRYRGRRSGRTILTPTQFARCDDTIVIVVAHPSTKSWWRNFEDDHDLDLLVQGTWVPMVGRAIVPADHPDEAAPLEAAYAQRFPRAARQLGREDRDRPLFVWCRPR